MHVLNASCIIIIDSAELSSRTVGETEESNTEANKLALSDIYEKTEENFTSSNTDQGASSSPTVTEKKDTRQHNDLATKSNTRTGEDSAPHHTDFEDPTMNSVFDPVPNTAWAAEAGTDLPSGRASEASSVPTYSNLVVRTVIQFS